MFTSAPVSNRASVVISSSLVITSVEVIMLNSDSTFTCCLSSAE